MFKNFLTYQLAQSFDRACVALEIESPEQKDLVRCSHQMVHHLTRSIHATESEERSRFLFVALTYLRDCKEIIDRTSIQRFDLVGRYEVLQGRLEQMFWENSAGEDGQLRMLG